MPVIMDKNISPEAWSSIEEAVRSSIPKEQADAVLEDGVITREEAVSSFLFDCNGDGKITLDDTVAKCRSPSGNSRFGDVAAILAKHGMKLEPGDAAALVKEAFKHKEAGRYDEALVAFKEAFAISDDPALKRAALMNAGRVSLQKADTPGVLHEDRPKLIEDARLFFEAVVAVSESAKDRLVISAAQFNLGQIAVKQYHQLKWKDPAAAEEMLNTAEKHFGSVLSFNPEDNGAKAKLDAIKSVRRGREVLTAKFVDMLRDPDISEEVKAWIVIPEIISRAIENGVQVPDAVNDFLQALVEYRPDLTDADEFKMPGKLFIDGWGDCDDWAQFVVIAFRQTDIEHYLMAIPNTVADRGHVGVLYRDKDGNFKFIDNEGIMDLESKDTTEAVKNYVLMNAGQAYDWKQIQLIEIPKDDLK